MKALSLGWGVQSFTLAAMSALGELEPVDVALHADTTHEGSGTYAYAAQWTSWLEARGVRVVTVQPTTASPTPRPHECALPAFTQAGTGRGGMLRRQCTKTWKIAPMRRWLQAHRQGMRVEQWLGISVDEASRMRDSDVQYIKHRYPLIERGMTRDDCVFWLVRHRFPVPPRSSCVFCPYQDQASWRRRHGASNGDWERAVAVDEAIRQVRPPSDLFVHPSRQPLRLVDFSPHEGGQLNLWDEECSGICGV